MPFINTVNYRYDMAIILIIASIIFLGLLLITLLLAILSIRIQVHHTQEDTSIIHPSIQNVQADYLRAMAWLGKNHFLSYSTRLTEAPMHLYGVFLNDYFATLQPEHPRFIGVLRCIHTLSVQPIKNDPLRCLVIDTQITRRMVTYCAKTYRRVATQDMGNATVVYEMCYDSLAKCWKLNRFIQELPNGWNGIKSAYPIELVTTFSGKSIGNDTG
ncbi:MAG: hypothetical protein CUN52_04235 [Phototrophicales bacterium]|nr:MAG: hypothetical protein CUN52_04235 [Phototrophicales bacterium]